MEAGKLTRGMRVRQPDGDYGAVERLVAVPSPQRMYNLTVEQAHTFFVGDGQWLVHNSDTGGCRVDELPVFQ